MTLDRMHRMDFPLQGPKFRRVPGSVRLFAGVGFLLAAAGCAGGTAEGPGGTSGRPIARVGGQPLTSESFQEYLVDVFGSLEEVKGGDELMSRLLDQYLEEQLLLVKAKRMELAADEEEVRRYLEFVAPGEAESGGDRERFLKRFRASLLTRKLKDLVIAQRVNVPPEEIEEFYRRDPERFHLPTVVRLRQILVDEREEAESIRKALLADVSRFQDLAGIHSRAPDKGRPRSYEEDELPEEVRRAIDVLRDGELTEIVEDSQGFHIFQLIGKELDQALPLSEVHRVIERMLYQEKSKKVLEDFLRELRAEIPVEILEENLSFRYVGRE